MKTFAKNNSFCEISKPSEGGCDITVYRSKVYKHCYTCTFNDFTIPLYLLCRNGLDEPITVSFYDHRMAKPPKLIGKSTATICHFMESINRPFVQTAKFCGPCYISPMIRLATTIAVNNWESSKTYTVLFIITYGEILDTLTVKEVTVTKKNWDEFEELDADKHDLKAKGVKMKRDIVQFVPFVKFKDASKSRLEAELLADLPMQVHEYCSTHGFTPVLQQSKLTS